MMKRAKPKARSNPKSKKDPNRYPKGWDPKSVRALANHYDRQYEDAAVAEDDAAYRSTVVTMMAIPVELVPKVQKLLSKRAG